MSKQNFKSFSAKIIILFITMMFDVFFLTVNVLLFMFYVFVLVTLFKTL